jgi:hypothetical protein
VTYWKIIFKKRRVIYIQLQKESNSQTIYRCKKKSRPNGVCSNYQGHEELEEQKLKKRSKSNLQTRNKTRLCNSKKKTQGLITRTCDV